MDKEAKSPIEPNKQDIGLPKQNGNLSSSDALSIDSARTQPSLGGDHELQLNAIADKLIASGVSSGAMPAIPRKRSRLDTYKHPMVVDLAIAIGLLFAMGALTISIVRTYIAHSAKTSIMQGNYKAAIQILRGAPVPDIFAGAGAENSDDLLNQALYLDAMEKLDNDHQDQTAPQELSKISPGSRFYDLAQDQLEHLSSQRQETPQQK